MRRYIFRAALTLCFLLLFTGVKAQQQLVVKFSNGADSKAFNLADIKKITFGDAYFKILEASNVYEYAYNAIAKMTFAQGTSAIGQVGADANDKFAVQVLDNRLRITGVAAGHLRVYSIDGRQLYADPSWKGSDVVFKHLPRGVFIVKVNNRTAKIHN